MKRASNPNAGSWNKKFRSDVDVGETTFEDELLLMESMVQEFVDADVTVEGIADQTSRWSRPPLCLDNSQSLAFHWLDIDMISGVPLSANPAGGDIVGSSEGPVPVIRMYGVDKEGHSILACIHGFTPYIYVSIPTSIQLGDTDLLILRNVVDQKV